MNEIPGTLLWIAALPMVFVTVGKQAPSPLIQEAGHPHMCAYPLHSLLHLVKREKKRLGPSMCNAPGSCPLQSQDSLSGGPCTWTPHGAHTLAARCQRPVSASACSAGWEAGLCIFICSVQWQDGASVSLSLTPKIHGLHAKLVITGT